jgi:hypothetical protein
MTAVDMEASRADDNHPWAMAVNMEASRIYVYNEESF